MLLATLIVLAALPAVGRGADGKAIQLTIPLDQGRYYRLHDFCREANEKLGAGYALDSLPDRRLELTPLDQAALLLAHESDLVSVRLSRDRLILTLPDPEEDSARRRNRRRLERLLGIELDDWPPQMGLHLPKPLHPAKRSVLLIHGLESEGRHLRRIREAFEAAGVQVLWFDYPNDGPPAWAGKRLSEELKALAAEHPRLRLAIVAHSLGGLVARYALEMPGLDPGNVTDLVCLGVPHEGSTLAGMQDWLELVCEGLPAGLRFDTSVRSGLGEASADLRPGSRFLAELNRQPRPGRVRYHLAIGSRAILTDRECAAVKQDLARFLDARDVPASRRERLLTLIACDELRTGKGDGAVTIRSATLPGAASRKVFDRSHAELLSLPGGRPERNEVFVWMLDVLGWK